MVRWTGLAPWELEFPFECSLTSTFLTALNPTAQQPLMLFPAEHYRRATPRTRWRSNPSDKCSQERLTRGTVTSTIRRAAHPSGCARCGAGAGCTTMKCQSLTPCAPVNLSSDCQLIISPRQRKRSTSSSSTQSGRSSVKRGVFRSRASPSNAPLQRYLAYKKTQSPRTLL